jgi:hypothetical protein
MERTQNPKRLNQNGLDGGRAGTRTPDLLRVNSSFLPYIADSYRGTALFPTSVRVSPALIEQLSEQQSQQWPGPRFPLVPARWEAEAAPVSAFQPPIATLAN